MDILKVFKITIGDVVIRRIPFTHAFCFNGYSDIVLRPHEVINLLNSYGVKKYKKHIIINE